MRLGICLSEESLDAEMAQARSGSPWVFSMHKTRQEIPTCRLECEFEEDGWSERLSEERIVRTEAWRCLKPNQRPAGRAGRNWAHSYLREVTLRFAQAASALAIALSASALVLASQ